MAEKKTAAKKAASPAAKFTLINWESDEHWRQILSIVDQYAVSMRSPVQFPVEWLVESLKAGYALDVADFGVTAHEQG